MKKFFLALCLASFFLPCISLAQDEPAQPFIAGIMGPQDSAVGRTIILDASPSRVPPEGVTYQWYINDSQQPISKTVDVIYTPEKTGTLVFRLVVRTTINGVQQESQAEHQVTVYKRKILLVADKSVPQDKLAFYVQAATEANAYLQVLQPADSSEDALVSVLSDNAASFAGAQSVVLWTDDVVGLQALLRAMEGDPDRSAILAGRTIVLLTSRSLQIVSRTASGPFSALKPERIVVTRPEALHTLLEAETPEKFLELAAQRDLEMQTTDASTVRIRPWNILSALVNYMLVHGVSSQTVMLLLMLPVIATILSFLRQVIGMTTFGLFGPAIIALSFLTLGWMVGVFFLVFILAAGYLTRSLMRSWPILYIPKMAIVLTVGSITLLLLVGIGASFGISLSRDTVFVLLIMSTLTENFLTTKSEQGLFSAISAVSQTVIAALICVFVVQWPPFQFLLLAYPELIFATILLNILIGRWTGLRLFEYFRFREVFRHLQEE